MKSILTILSVVCVASFGFTGCATSTKCHTKVCPVTKKSCSTPGSCCSSSTGACPVKKSQ